MKITLPKEVTDNLPAPSSDDGLIRVTVGLKLGADGTANLLEMNDSPLPTSDEEAEEEAENPSDSDAPAPPDEMEAMGDARKSASEQLGALY